MNGQFHSERADKRSPTRCTRLGLAGTGGYGVHHREVLKGLDARGVLEWVAAADPAMATDSMLAHQLGALGVRCHESLGGMLWQEEGLDAVVLATPIPLHFEMVELAMRRGLHVLLEKPPIPLISQLDELLKMNGSEKVAVGFQHVCSRPMLELRRLVAGGVLGKILEIRAGACWPRFDHYYDRAVWAGRLMLDGTPVFDGPATNALSHVIHNAMLIAARPGERTAMPETVQGEFYRARPIESYDSACLRCVFPGGIRFTAAFSHSTRELVPFRLRIIGEKGTAEIGADGSELRVNGKPFSAWTTDDIPPSVALYQDFLAFCRGDAPAPATRLSDTRGFLTMTCGAMEAAGAIHPVPSRFVERIEDNDGGLYHVEDLSALVERSLETGELFSEMGAEWAVSSPCKKTSELKGLDLSTICRNGSVYPTLRKTRPVASIP